MAFLLVQETMQKDIYCDPQSSTEQNPMHDELTDHQCVKKLCAL